MLKEIYCEKFSQKSVVFNKGLNIISGDSEGTNSIGKTTMLYILDFVFGGNSYIDKNDEIINHIGQHQIYFALEFNKIMYYFSRSTDSKNVIQYEEKYIKEMRTLSLSDYTSFLKVKYNLTEIDETFRNIVVRFSRIYRMGTSSSEEPFAATEKESRKRGISLLLNLFEKNTSINSIRKQKELVELEQKTFNDAKKYSLVPTINKMQMTKNIKDIQVAEKEKIRITTDNQVESLSVDAVVSSELIDLKAKKSKYTIELSSVTNDIKKLSVKDEKTSSIDYNELNSIFPDISIKRIEEIQDFHKNLRENLTTEILEFISVLENKKRMLISEISKCDDEFKKISNIKKVPVAILSKYSLLDQKIAKMTLENEYYFKGIDIYNRKQKAIEEYNKSIENSIKEINIQINKGIEEYNTLIDKGDEHQIAPKIELAPNTYKIDFNVDKGTGTAYSTLISIDLVMIRDTKLPYIIEDSIIFKNISNQRMRNIIDIYNNMDEKQIFIALDKINEYGEKIVSIATPKIVIQLSEAKPLFGKRFSIEK